MIRKKSKMFLLTLSALSLSFFQSNVFAEGNCNSEEYQIVEFKKLTPEDSYTYLLDEVMPKPEELKKIMPDSLTAITKENENISIPVEWYCDEKEYYDDTVYTIVFEPKFDTAVYNVEEECELPLFYVDVKAREKYKPSTLNLTGNGNEDTCYNFLRNSVGLNCASSCGVLGNLYVECSFNPLAHNSKENAWGICQWRDDRLSKLQSRYPNSWKTLDSQLNFLVDEFNGADYSGPKTLSYLRGRADDSNGAQEAAQYFAQYFERCASSTYASRKNWAVKFYNDRKVAHDPFGYLDSCSGGEGVVNISGWVADWDDPGAALSVHVYVGGPAGSGAPGYAITADKYRSDVNDAYPGIGNNHGFEDRIAVSPRGNQKLYIYGLNVGGGENILIGEVNVTINEPVHKYFLDINGFLDGKEDGGLRDYGTCDVYINGELKADDCNDFYTSNGTWEQGSTYEIKDIKATKCHKYEGVHSGSLSGTLNSDTSVSLEFTTAHDYDVEIIETTCTVLGSKTYTCKNCGDSYTENDTELLPHDYRQEPVEATCVNPAGTKYTCKNCGYTYTEYADADWSDWSETYPEGIDEKLIESRTEYSYSDKQTKTSEKSSLSGWTQTGSETVYGSWGGWSAWQTDPIASSETVNVASEKVYRYYYFYCPVCGGREPFQGRSDCGKYTLTLSDGHVGWFTLPYSQSNPQSYSYTTAKVYTTAPDGNRWNFSKSNLNDTAIGTLDDGNGSVVIATGYRSRTRTKTIVYKYEKWGDWSDWTATAVTGSSDRQVKTRTVYRYNRTPYGKHNYDEGTISNNTITYKCVNCDETKEMPLITINDNTGILAVKLAETNKITAQGIVYGEENDITLETPGRTRISYSEIDSNRSYSFDMTELTGYTVRAYVAYTDQNGNEQVIYSEAYSR